MNLKSNLFNFMKIHFLCFVILVHSLQPTTSIQAQQVSISKKSSQLNHAPPSMNDILPAEIISDILTYLHSPEDYQVVQSTCKYWYDITNDLSFSKKMMNLYIEKPFIENIVKIISNLKNKKTNLYKKVYQLFSSRSYLNQYKKFLISSRPVDYRFHYNPHQHGFFTLHKPKDINVILPAADRDLLPTLQDEINQGVNNRAVIYSSLPLMASMAFLSGIAFLSVVLTSLEAEVTPQTEERKKLLYQQNGKIMSDTLSSMYQAGSILILPPILAAHQSIMNIGAAGYNWAQNKIRAHKFPDAYQFEKEIKQEFGEELGELVIQYLQQKLDHENFYYDR